MYFTLELHAGNLINKLVGPRTALFMTICTLRSPTPLTVLLVLTSTAERSWSGVMVTENVPLEDESSYVPPGARSVMVNCCCAASSALITPFTKNPMDRRSLSTASSTVSVPAVASILHESVSPAPKP